MKDDARLSAVEATLSSLAAVVADLVQLPEYQLMLERRLAADMQRRMHAAQVAARPPTPAPRAWIRVALHGGRDIESFGPGRHVRDGVPGALYGGIEFQVCRGGHAPMLAQQFKELKREDPWFASLLESGTLTTRSCTLAEAVEIERQVTVNLRMAGANPSLGESIVR